MSGNIDSVPALDLILDHSRHRVTRGSRHADFGGNCRRWAVLTELAKRAGGYCPKDDLITAVWGRSDPAFEGIDDGTVYTTVFAVRRALHDLGITISHTKGLGYRLREIRR
jgi:DNA-binding winged helix-turn-helix (wHTH) protein